MPAAFSFYPIQYFNIRPKENKGSRVCTAEKTSRMARPRQKSVLDQPESYTETKKDAGMTTRNLGRASRIFLMRNPQLNFGSHNSYFKIFVNFRK